MKDKNYKKKLDILRHHMNTAKRIASYVENIEEREPTELKEDINKGVAQKELMERSFIHTVANISTYKDSMFYQLKLVSQSIKKLEKQKIEYNPLLKLKNIKLAKKRIGSIIAKLT